MELGEKRIEQLAKMPVIESRVFKSKDGKYLVSKTIITSIKPVAYYQTILDSKAVEIEEE